MYRLSERSVVRCGQEGVADAIRQGASPSAGYSPRLPVFDQLLVGIARNGDPCDRDLPSRRWDSTARLNQVPLMRASHRPARGYPLAIDQFIIYRDLEVRKRHARPSDPLLVVVAVAQLWCRRRLRIPHHDRLAAAIAHVRALVSIHALVSRYVI
jgi:hypothetical protein